jgi:hypothetical protein
MTFRRARACSSIPGAVNEDIKPDNTKTIGVWIEFLARAIGVRVKSFPRPIGERIECAPGSIAVNVEAGRMRGRSEKNRTKSCDSSQAHHKVVGFHNRFQYSSAKIAEWIQKYRFDAPRPTQYPSAFRARPNIRVSTNYE